MCLSPQNSLSVHHHDPMPFPPLPPPLHPFPAPPPPPSLLVPPFRPRHSLPQRHSPLYRPYPPVPCIPSPTAVTPSHPSPHVNDRMGCARRHSGEESATRSFVLGERDVSSVSKYCSVRNKAEKKKTVCYKNKTHRTRSLSITFFGGTLIYRGKRGEMKKTGLFHGSGHGLRVGSGEGDPVRPVIFEDLLPRPVL